MSSQVGAFTGSGGYGIKKRKVAARRSFKKTQFKGPMVNYVPRSVPQKINTYKLRIKTTNFFISDGAGNINVKKLMYDPSACSDWTILGSLYDQFRINSVTLHFQPTVPMVDQTTSTVQYYRQYYVLADSDSDTAPGTVDIALQYDNCKIYDSWKAWSYKVYPPRQIQSASTTHVIDIQGWMDVASVAQNTVGCIFVVGDNFKFSTTFGDSVLEYIIEFKDRR